MSLGPSLRVGARQKVYGFGQRLSRSVIMARRSPHHPGAGLGAANTWAVSLRHHRAAPDWRSTNLPSSSSPIL